MLYSLMFPEISPIAFQVGPFSVHWYALAYVFGILGALWYGKKRLLQEKLWGGPPPLSGVLWDDFLLWATLGVVLGGRTGYVLFYQPAFYFANPLEIIQIWHGGMSFHGGFLGVTVASYFFCRCYKIPFDRFLDLLASGVPIGLGFGRLANFINGELYGRITDVPWGMVFPDGGLLPRHPSQLYEAFLEGFVLFCLLKWVSDRHNALRYKGLIAGLFALGYSIFRISAEYFREPDFNLGYLFSGVTMGMLLSLPLLCVGVWLSWRALRKQKTS